MCTMESLWTDHKSFQSIVLMDRNHMWLLKKLNKNDWFNLEKSYLQPCLSFQSIVVGRCALWIRRWVHPNMNLCRALIILYSLTHLRWSIGSWARSPLSRIRIHIKKFCSHAHDAWREWLYCACCMRGSKRLPYGNGAVYMWFRRRFVHGRNQTVSVLIFTCHMYFFEHWNLEEEFQPKCLSQNLNK